ncbi:type II toxin-antitoxin system Phd/YefM family antitoxin [Ectothiorhodospiraceae bacterium BW-2]|nr:type II toxin-antitoxin system Phd/YefM family antitoxin [Ectothiorhodospiraceae bacterium BW-2]
MNQLYSEQAISLSEFQQSPVSILQEAGERPVVVFDHDHPAFYLISPRFYEALVEELVETVVEAELRDTLLQRLQSRDQAVEVDIDTV